MKQTIFALLLFFSFSVLAQGQDLAIKSFQFGTDIENRNIVNVDSVFTNTVERVYCFTEIEGAEGSTTITHVWHYGDEQKARVELPVKGSDWRTWSSKRILESWTGEWSVDILNSSGEVLATKTFRVQSAVANQ